MHQRINSNCFHTYFTFQIRPDEGAVITCSFSIRKYYINMTLQFYRRDVMIHFTHDVIRFTILGVAKRYFTNGKPKSFYYCMFNICYLTLMWIHLVPLMNRFLMINCESLHPCCMRYLTLPLLKTVNMHEEGVRALLIYP